MIPLTPLGAEKARIDTHGPITLAEVTDMALASFAARLGHEAKARSAIQALSGAQPPEPGQATLGEIGLIWTGPDQWMVMAPHDSHEDLAAQLKAKAGATASVTEQNDGWCRFDLTGPKLPDVFERLCPVPVGKHKGGEATRTSIDHLGCFVLTRSPEHISVLGPRSSAGSLHHALHTAIVAVI